MAIPRRTLVIAAAPLAQSLNRSLRACRVGCGMRSVRRTSVGCQQVNAFIQPVRDEILRLRTNCGLPEITPVLPFSDYFRIDGMRRSTPIVASVKLT